MNRERRDNILIFIGLMIGAVVLYLQEKDGWILALTIVISASATFGVYWIARRYRKRHPKTDEIRNPHSN